MLQKMFPAFGTVNSILVAEHDDVSVLDQIKNRMLQLHKRFSFFDPESEIGQINRQAGIQPVAVSGDTFFLLSRALEYAQETQGTFDVMAGPLSKLWKKAIRSGVLPSDAEIERCRSLCTVRNLVLDAAHGTAFLREKGMKLDLGGLAKGYAADTACAMLRAKNIQNARINFGGTVVVLGKPQKVGIQNPFEKTGRAMADLVLQDKAVVTSGVYEQCSFSQGKRVHHIIDPRTGKPSDAGLLSVSLIGEEAVTLDALATAICCLGMVAGADLVRKHGISAVFVTESGSVQITPELQEKICLAGERKTDAGRAVL